ncbi:oxidoreductase [Paenibacillus sp. FSL R7-0273]|uniref:SDR family NAD(P)-dependent oxidoreductase n=1 Tax=Paenibacillus sp. FSL R7-0273 TaxID=1536772 RepID=UPI0004F8DA31|nr:SDR family NAD(P)-dependent oxidoreductase [Paenibacillus sp. FSL R7-0273]AIQ48205.1 oxidoreductase [Paenibacillus sp. FSL R7-0273]OMF91970.1 oxidoreductase [Paenibacillus sp. FSL R7-0273]
MTKLQGKIALVTGGSRGAGRGIALELAKAGAFVYITGRSTGLKQAGQLRGTIDSVCNEIVENGGEAAAIHCDHTNDQETERVIRQIAEEKGRLDILVNNVWGGNQLPIGLEPFWEQPPAHWSNMFESGVRAQLMTNYYAVPLMRSTKDSGGLIIHTTFWDRDKYTGNFYYDLAKNALIRMAYGLSVELAADGIAVIPLSPGWMRTELVLEEFGTDEEHWQEVEALKNTESTAYIGRAVVALAEDTGKLSLSGIPQQVGVLAEKYGFTDSDGRRVPAFLMEE